MIESINLIIIRNFLGKSSKEGVLITHNMFKYTKNNASRDLKTWWYTCSFKVSHGCTGRAIVHRVEFTGDDGDLYVKNTLVEVATPELHAQFHCPDQAGVIADHVMVNIKEAIDKNPTAPVGVYKILYRKQPLIIIAIQYNTVLELEDG